MLSVANEGPYTKLKQRSQELRKPPMDSKRAGYPSADPSDYPTEKQQNEKMSAPNIEARLAAKAGYPSADPSDYPLKAAAQRVGSRP